MVDTKILATINAILVCISLSYSDAFTTFSRPNASPTGRISSTTRNELTRINADRVPSKFSVPSSIEQRPELLQKPLTPRLASVTKVEKFARLPVWPAWNGVFLFVLSRVLGEETAAKLEDAIGGRVCPNFFPPNETSPFIMLVHHRHSFASWDPLRFLQRTFFPEGFPAHPHRGFITVTYFMKGGFTHRDSLGIRQSYGADEKYGGKHTQWLTTGKGLLHEEMWDLGNDPDAGPLDFFKPKDMELYQLWLNMPAREKLCDPKIELLGGAEETPTILEDGTSTVVICGEHGGKRATVRTASEVTILHVTMAPNSEWTHTVPSTFGTTIMYMRKGAVTINDTRVPPHYTATVNSSGGQLKAHASGEDGADFFLLSGVPLNEPVAAQGSMVMNRADEIDQAYADYQTGAMGRPWSEGLTDEEWMDHTKQFPSAYKPQSTHF